MYFTQYTAVKDKFARSPNLCDLFKLLSIETWKRMEYAYTKPRIRLFETTITQNLIFTINAFNDQHSLNIDMLEASDENTNGNDFELIIRFPAEGIEFYAPVQAKKINRNGRYISMEHGIQIESLMNYAARESAKAFYLLYNFTALPFKSGATVPNPPELAGCTFISAEYLFNHFYNKKKSKSGTPKWKIPNFDDLHPDYAFSWHEIVCPGNSTELIRKLQTKKIIPEDLSTEGLQGLVKIGVLENNGLGFFALNTFTADNNWINIKQLPSPFSERFYEMIPKSKRLKDDEPEKTNLEFSPRARIILTQKQ